MKKILALLCSCLMIFPILAHAENEFKLEAEVTGTRLLQKWNGQTSEENDWFAVDLQLTNWHVDEQNIADLLSGRLVFKDAYSFDGVPVFDGETISPLVEKNGSLVFEIPKMVSRMFSPEYVQVFISVDGEERAIETDTASIPGQRTGTLEGIGFDSPEDAVLAYLNGLNEGDASVMLSTFALESYVEHADPEGILRRMRSFSLSVINGIPVSSDYSKSIMLNARYGELARVLLNQYVELSASTNGSMLVLNDEAAINELQDKFASSPVNKWYGNVEFVEWIDPGRISGKIYHVQNLCAQAIAAACAGAEDYVELAAHIKLNGLDAVQLMACVRYGDRWYNLTYQSTLASILGISHYYAGLIYPVDGVSWEDQVETEFEPESEISAFLENAEESELTGTYWKLDSIDIPDISARVCDSAEEALNDTGMSIFADLRFMHLGGAVMDFRLSPSLAESTDASSSYMKTVSVWSDDGRKLRFEVSRGLGGEHLYLEDARCTKTDDTITFTFGENGSITFRRVQE